MCESGNEEEIGFVMLSGQLHKKLCMIGTG